MEIVGERRERLHGVGPDRAGPRRSARPPQSMPATFGLMRSSRVGEVRRERRGRRARDSAIGHLQEVETSGHREHASEQTPKRDRHAGGVTNDQYVTPRTTLSTGTTTRTSVATASAPGCDQHPTSEAARMLASPPVSGPMSRGKRHMDRCSGLICDDRTSSGAFARVRLYRNRMPPGLGIDR